MRLQRQQPTRLPHPWDSPGKNTGVGCHFLLQCMKVKSKVKSLSHVRLLATPWTAAHQAPPSMGFSRLEYWSGVPLPSPSGVCHKFHMAALKGKVTVAQSCLTLSDPMDSPWNSPGQNTGEGDLSLLQGILPTQGLNPGLPHCRWILYQLSHQGSPLFTTNLSTI